MTSYATAPGDVTKYGLQPFAIQNVLTATLQAQLDAASDEADSYLRARGQLPLTSWGTDLTQKVVWLAGPAIMAVRGFNPDAGADIYIDKRREEAIEWFRGVERGSVHPNIVFQVTPSQDPTYSSPQVKSDAQRGWSQTDGNGTPSI